MKICIHTGIMCMWRDMWNKIASCLQQWGLGSFAPQKTGKRANSIAQSRWQQLLCSTGASSNKDVRSVAILPFSVSKIHLHQYTEICPKLSPKSRSLHAFSRHAVLWEMYLHPATCRAYLHQGVAHLELESVYFVTNTNRAVRIWLYFSATFYSS